MICVWFGGDNSGPSTSVANFTFIAPAMTSGWTGTENQRQIPISEDITVTKFVIRIDTAPGVGKSYAFTLRDDGVDSAATVTISDSNLSAEWNGSEAIAALSLLGLESTPTGTPAVFTNWHIEIWYTTTGNKQLLIGADSNAASTTVTNYHQPHGGHGTTWATDPLAFEALIPTDCTATKLVVATGDGSPGTGKSYAISMRTDNTTDSLTATIADTNTVASVTGSIDLTPGQTIVMKSVPTGTPTARRPGWCITIEPDTAGELVMGFGSAASPSTTAVNYEQIYSVGNNGWNSAENVRLNQPPAGTYKKLYGKLTTAPGVGKSRTFTFRDNSTDSALAITISDAATIANDTTDSVVFAGGGNLATFKSTPTATPAASAGVKLGYVLAISQGAGTPPVVELLSSNTGFFMMG